MQQSQFEAKTLEKERAEKGFKRFGQTTSRAADQSQQDPLEGSGPRRACILFSGTLNGRQAHPHDWHGAGQNEDRHDEPRL